MAITRATARLLLEELKRRPFEGSVLQLGRMVVFFREDELRSWARRHGVELAANVKVALSHDPVLAAHGCMDDESFFRLIGFEEVSSIDAERWEGASYEVDLNEPVPEHLHGRFDMVFEGGTLGSIFDVPEVFANLRRLLRKGGRVIHAMSHSHNMVDLGFYMFSPTLFHDVYETAGWKRETLLLCEYVAFWTAGRLATGPVDVYRYEPGALDHLSYGRFGDKLLSFFVVATKSSDSDLQEIPQQSYYQRLWAEDHESRRCRLEDTARTIAARQPWYRGWLYHLYRYLGELIRRRLPRRMPERVARL
ncbi:MAG: class I SAM-dependent methyltransferase [Holophagales bacterium]|nr:class I SAM-dependent methyltransferase [Holophagales bacterium]